MDLYFLDHLCFFWTVGIINNHITEKSLYFENRPVIILKVLQNVVLFNSTLFLLRQKFSDFFIFHSIVPRKLTLVVCKTLLWRLLTMSMFMDSIYIKAG